MTWVRLDEQFPDHPKVAMAGPLAAWLHVCALGYCNRYLTDGFVPAGQVAKLADFSEFPKVRALDLAGRLVAAAMWKPAPGGFLIHDFDVYQPTKAQIEAERLAKSEGGKKTARRRWGDRPKAPTPVAGAIAGATATPIAGAHAPPIANGVAPPVADPIADGCPVSVSGSVPDLSLSSVGGLRLLGPESAKGGEGNPQTNGRPEPVPPWAGDRHAERWQGFSDRVVAVLGERQRQASYRLVDRWRTILAHQLIDQALGQCEHAEKKPQTVAYFEKTLRTTARQNDVDVPAIPAESAGA